MTKRKRFLSALDMKESDYIAFWPKLSDAYIYFNRKSLSSEIKTILDCHKYIGSEINH